MEKISEPSPLTGLVRNYLLGKVGDRINALLVKRLCLEPQVT